MLICHSSHSFSLINKVLGVFEIFKYMCEFGKHAVIFDKSENCCLMLMLVSYLHYLRIYLRIDFYSGYIQDNLERNGKKYIYILYLEPVSSPNTPDTRLSKTSWSSIQALFKKHRSYLISYTLYTTLLLSEIYVSTKFQVDTFYSSQVMSRTKFKVSKIPKCNNSKIREGRDMVLCTALLLNEIYLPTKILVNTPCSLQLYPGQSVKTKDNNYKIIRQSCGSCALHFYSMKSKFEYIL